MRIIAGRYRHRPLLSNPGSTTRPITDRAKVMLFDYIRDRMPGRLVADLCCGTGSLGFEALSRGARRVVFIERDHKAHELLRKNVAALKVESDVLCWRIDMQRCSLKPKGGRGEQPWVPYGVVFFDPPYADAADYLQGTSGRILQRLLRPDITTDDVLLVVRTPVEADLPMPPGWIVERTIEQGSMRITLAGKDPHAAAVAAARLLTADDPEAGVDAEAGAEAQAEAEAAQPEGIRRDADAGVATAFLDAADLNTIGREVSGPATSLGERSPGTTSVAE